MDSVNYGDRKLHWSNFGRTLWTQLSCVREWIISNWGWTRKDHLSFVFADFQIKGPFPVPNGSQTVWRFARTEWSSVRVMRSVRMTYNILLWARSPRTENIPSDGFSGFKSDPIINSMDKESFSRYNWPINLSDRTWSVTYRKLNYDQYRSIETSQGSL